MKAFSPGVRAAAAKTISLRAGPKAGAPDDTHPLGGAAAEDVVPGLSRLAFDGFRRWWLPESDRALKAAAAAWRPPR